MLQFTESGAYHRDRATTKPVRYYNKRCRLQEQIINGVTNLARYIYSGAYSITL